MPSSNIKRTTVTLPKALTETLLKMTHSASQTEAVVLAMTQEIKRRKLEKIRSLSGKLDFASHTGRHYDPRLR